MVASPYSPLPPWPESTGSVLAWDPDPQQYHQLQQLFWGLLDRNQRVNLTRITSPADFLDKHIWDSLCGIAPWLGSEPTDQGDAVVSPAGGQRVIDIGTGGGFPGLPVAIVRPDWHLTLLDATRKKMVAVEELAQALNLANVTTLAERSETLAQQSRYRERFDLALVRAVGSASTCAEYALPLLNLGGTAVLYRGQWTAAEAAILERAVPQLGGAISAVRAATTPLTGGTRHYVELTKLRATPAQFPRSVGMPAKSPLGA